TCGSHCGCHRCSPLHTLAHDNENTHRPLPAQGASHRTLTGVPADAAEKVLFDGWLAKLARLDMATLPSLIVVTESVAALSRADRSGPGDNRDHGGDPA
ncbi:MAG: hypothetical protein M0Z28_25040, partial [Rhodospirillales bacterium]|nr:hypothetical protein [Rhodospirillales bacterium]